MYALRKWSVRHARLMESLYAAVERVLLTAAPLIERIGHERLEKPVAGRRARDSRDPCSIAGCAGSARCRAPACRAR